MEEDERSAALDAYEAKRQYETELTQALEIRLARRQMLAAESVQKLYNRKDMEQGFLECFELVGGVPRLAIWANEPKNYEAFLRLLMKFAPKDLTERGAGVINFVSSIPDSPLNNPQPDHLRLPQTYENDEDGD